jgi:competence protein ComEA
LIEERRMSGFVWVTAAILLLAAGYRYIQSRPPARPPVEIAEATAGERKRAQAPLYVHVAGAVRRPGLYKLPDGARIATAIELARGPRPKADLTTVNLAAKIEDGQQIIVPLRGTAQPVAGGAGAPATAGSGTASTGAPGQSSPTAQISLATATQAQLEELDGIGPALAQAILAYRDANGGFRSIEQLQEVDGIGEKRFEALRNAVRP